MLWDLYCETYTINKSYTMRLILWDLNYETDTMRLILWYYKVNDIIKTKYDMKMYLPHGMMQL